MPAGQKLKTLRNERNITVREVEQASRRIAEAKGDKRFCISNGWLAQLENGLSEPSICKLSSLSVIYQTNLLELLRLYNVDVDDKENYRPVADPNLTQLLSDKSEGNGRAESVSGSGLKPLYTSLLSELKMVGPDGSEPNITYGYLGLTDFTMYPMIRPGALLKIDTSQNKLTTPAWRNEFERPIFFIELRDAYACGWCELQGNQLLIIPYHSCTASVRGFTYLREAEIVGRVIGYSTLCVDLDT
ncbi:MAG TPA: helix-turn-helix transcriptional regulator [Pyrinomonadaceae bacterium]|nr:helix-turn-helix transcriptional regulator [Pyrinomonadaceae bacterium]